jgi:hypothetical protein
MGGQRRRHSHATGVLQPQRATTTKGGCRSRLSDGLPLLVALAVRLDLMREQPYPWAAGQAGCGAGGVERLGKSASLGECRASKAVASW